MLINALRERIFTRSERERKRAASATRPVLGTFIRAECDDVDLKSYLPMRLSPLMLRHL